MGEFRPGVRTEEGGHSRGLGACRRARFRPPGGKDVGIGAGAALKRLETGMNPSDFGESGAQVVGGACQVWMIQDIPAADSRRDVAHAPGRGIAVGAKPLAPVGLPNLQARVPVGQDSPGPGWSRQGIEGATAQGNFEALDRLLLESPKPREYGVRHNPTRDRSASLEQNLMGGQKARLGQELRASLDLARERVGVTAQSHHLEHIRAHYSKIIGMFRLTRRAREGSPQRVGPGSPHPARTRRGHTEGRYPRTETVGMRLGPSHRAPRFGARDRASRS